MIITGELAGVLEDRGFTEDEDSEFCELAAGPVTVRVAVWGGYTVVRTVSGGLGLMRWEAVLSPGTPLPVITSVIDQAIREEKP